jgi:hypothetical protein
MSYIKNCKSIITLMCAYNSFFTVFIMLSWFVNSLN